MRPFSKKLEWFFDKMIVPALLVLLVIVIVDVFYTGLKYEYSTEFLAADLFVLFVFAGDLSFKFRRAASWQGFLRREWLEILAVIPFFWVFRLIESVARIGELVQEIIHLVARGSRLARLFAVFGLVGTRHNRFQDFLKRISKSDRFHEAAKFFQHPHEAEEPEKE